MNNLSQRLQPYKERIVAANARWNARRKAKDKSENLVRVRLETGDGQFVSDVLVMPFKVAPDVVLWGSRYFQLHQENPATYRECFATVAFSDQNDPLNP